MLMVVTRNRVWVVKKNFKLLSLAAYSKFIKVKKKLTTTKIVYLKFLLNWCSHVYLSFVYYCNIKNLTYNKFKCCYKTQNIYSSCYKNLMIKCFTIDVSYHNYLINRITELI